MVSHSKPVRLEFSGEVWFWKGPAPWYFVSVPPQQAAEIKDVASRVTYGWGMIPVTARIGETIWTTSLWPKDGSYILPIKSTVRRAEKIAESETVTAQLEISLS